MNVISLLFAASSAAIGFLVAWLIFRSNAAVLDSRLSTVQQELVKAHDDTTRFRELNSVLNRDMAVLGTAIVHQRGANEGKMDLLSSATEKLRESLKTLSADALTNHNHAFL